MMIIPRCEAYQAMVHSTASEDQKAELFDSLTDEGFQVCFFTRTNAKVSLNWITAVASKQLTLKHCSGVVKTF